MGDVSDVNALHLCKELGKVGENTLGLGLATVANKGGKLRGAQRAGYRRLAHAQLEVQGRAESKGTGPRDTKQQRLRV